MQERVVVIQLVVVACCFLAVALAQFPAGTYVQLWECNGSIRQQFDISRVITPGGDQTIRIKAAPDNCLDIAYENTDNGATLHTWSCHTSDKDPKHQNQEWIWDANKHTFTGVSSKRCLEAALGGTADGTAIDIWDCNGASYQSWYYNETDFTLRNGQARHMCIDAGTTVPAACTGPPTSNYPFCNTALSVEARARDLVSRIPQLQKYSLLGANAGPVPALGIGEYRWGSEALHGVAGSGGVDYTGNTTCATSFAQVCTTGATFDTDLWAQIGIVTSTEARAFSNAGHAGLTFWTPNLNIFRDPRWGRGQETPGEDPYQTSQYVLHYVPGLQQSALDPKHLKVSACCKHFAAYSLEKWGGQDRAFFNAIVTEQDLADTFYPAFEACISPNGAAAAGIMCSYNAINGIPACADPSLLTGLARNTWKFDGYITGDCGAVENVQTRHNYTKNPNDTCAVVIDSGVDLDCGGFLPAYTYGSVESGKLSAASVDLALAHQVSVHIRLGLYDPPSTVPYTKIGVDQINTPAAQALALRGAREGIVLLKNDRNVLPLKPDLDMTVAVIGPNANATTVMQGDYSGPSCIRILSPWAAISKYAKTVYAEGVSVNANVTTGFAEACNAAKSAKATIIVAGLTNQIETEGRDRYSLEWPGVQHELIFNVTNCATGGPVILVVFGGGPIDLTSVRDSKAISAILWAGYGGQSGGQAIADAIFGVFSPAGRLPHTVYPADYVNQVPMTDMGFRPSAHNPGRTYRFYTGTPVYPYGYGMSYTEFTFKYTNISESVRLRRVNAHLAAESASFLTAPAIAAVEVQVTNVGKVTSDVVVLAFISGPNAGKGGNPIKSLFGFTRFWDVAPGETKTITFRVTAFDLSVVDAKGVRKGDAGQWVIDVEGQKTVLHVEK